MNRQERAVLQSLSIVSLKGRAKDNDFGSNGFWEHREKGLQAMKKKT
jgi:hypothetical protein